MHHLLIIQDDQGRKEFPLDGPVYTIGRDSHADIRLFSQFVSRRHAMLIQRSRHDGSTYYQIIDGDSSGKPSANGILINGHKVSTHDLINEDEIVFGPQVRAIYYLLGQEDMTTGTQDEWDVTLISPNMLPIVED